MRGAKRGAEEACILDNDVHGRGFTLLHYSNSSQLQIELDDALEQVAFHVTELEDLRAVKGNALQLFKVA